ncbi:MAG: 3-hydroxyacyl-ACP dehydratase FabZ family protein [Pirellulaceae bacterium]
MKQPEITAAIPHRPPMLLVDEVVELTEQRIVARKTFRAGEYFFQGHYPGKPIVPGVILCECGMQAGAILLARFVPPDSRDQVPVATRLNDVKFKKVIQPGDVIDMEVTLNDQVSSAFFLTAKVSCQGKLATRFDFACTMTTVQ